MKYKALKKFASVVVIWLAVYCIVAFATLSFTFPLELFGYIVTRAVFLVATILLQWLLPPVDDLLEDVFS